MTDQHVNDLVAALLDLNGVEKVHVETTITVTHRRRNTGEMDDMFNEIRERIVSEEKFEGIAEEFGCRHHGTVDVIGDYHLEDNFSHRRTIEDDDND